MHLSAKNLFFVSAFCYVLPFVLTELLFFVVPPDFTAEPSDLEVALGWLSTIGVWVGLAAFILGLLNWKK